MPASKFGIVLRLCVCVRVCARVCAGELALTSLCDSEAPVIPPSSVFLFGLRPPLLHRHVFAEAPNLHLFSPLCGCFSGHGHPGQQQQRKHRKTWKNICFTSRSDLHEAPRDPGPFLTGWPRAGPDEFSCRTVLGFELSGAQL